MPRQGAAADGLEGSGYHRNRYGNGGVRGGCHDTIIGRKIPALLGIETPSGNFSFPGGGTLRFRNCYCPSSHYRIVSRAASSCAVEAAAA